MNASDESMATRVCDFYGPFDIIFDDASHISYDVIRSFEINWQCLRSDGIYVVKVKFFLIILLICHLFIYSLYSL